MQSNITIRMDADIKEEMAELCKQLGMSPSVAFNIFAKAFVRSKGMPFQVTMQQPAAVPEAQMMQDASRMLHDFSADYRRLAE